MNWEQETYNILDKQSRNQLVHQLAQAPEEIKDVIKVIKGKQERTAWRAAWVIDHLNQQYPELVTPYLKEIKKLVKVTPYHGARRSLLKILVVNPTPINEDGELVDLCLQWICNPFVPIAVRAYAMQFIYDILPAYPELKNEFQLSLETAIDDKSKGVRGKARKILNKLLTSTYPQTPSLAYPTSD